MASDDTRKVAGLIGDNKLSMLTTVAPDGTLTSRPMALQETEFDGTLWFFTERDARKVRDVAVNAQVNVTVGSGSTWVSLTGTATPVDDAAKKRDLWNAGVGAWFPGGPDDDGIGLLRVDADSAEYWDTPGGRVASLISFAKAKVTGEPYSGGDNERVRM